MLSRDRGVLLMRIHCFVLGIVAVGLTVGRTMADDEEAAKLNDFLLREEPLTIVFRQIRESPPFGEPSRWYWSINSAGQGCLTIGSLKPTQQKMELSVEQMAAIRKTLCEEQFVSFKQSYGPLYSHGGWSTLTVIAGEHINKTVRFNSTWSWDSKSEQAALAERVPALRVWLAVTGVLDPDGRVLEERKNLAAALKAFQK
jgi:hypothetical protein